MGGMHRRRAPVIAHPVRIARTSRPEGTDAEEQIMSEQTPVPAAPTPPAPAAPAPLKKGLATAALVLGIVAIVGAWIPILNIGSIIIALVGLVLGIVAIVQAIKGTAAGKVMAIVGASLSALAIIIAIVVNAATVAAVDEALDEVGGDISATTETSEPAADAEDDAAAEEEPVEETAPETGTISNPAAVGDGTVWTIAQGGDEWEITFDAIQVVAGIGGDQVVVVTGTATPTAIADGDLSTWVSFPTIGWMAGGAKVDETFDIPDTDAFDSYRHTIDLEATVGTSMDFYSSAGLPEGVVPDLMTVDTIFGNDPVYFATGLE